MPPLKKALSRNFSREASGLLTIVGHGRLLIFGDSSLDVPDKAWEDARVIYYLGNTAGDITCAAALKEVADTCPLDEKIPVRYMLKDKNDKEQRPAPEQNAKVIQDLGFKALGLVKDGSEGFYEFSKGAEPSKPPIYCLTASELAYDCIAATIGHSQV